MIASALAWAAYLLWLGLFVGLAWSNRKRTLLGLGIAMTVAFVCIYAWAGSELSVTGRDRSADMAYGLVVMAAVAVLVVPLVVAALIYPIGRLWTRW